MLSGGPTELPSLLADVQLIPFPEGSGRGVAFTSHLILRLNFCSFLCPFTACCRVIFALYFDLYEKLLTFFNSVILVQLSILL
jgi:hypothetical protein